MYYLNKHLTHSHSLYDIKLMTAVAATQLIIYSMYMRTYYHKFTTMFATKNVDIPEDITQSIKDTHFFMQPLNFY